jgi:NAD(P)-dependent dehydrogenase (short-subunit alcohol dehydrogenase family)
MHLDAVVALAAAYRERGYALVAVARAMTPSEDPNVLTVSGDLSRPGIGARIVEQAMDRFGRIDTVVNNAGVYIEKPFTDYTDADYDLVTGVNLRGFFDVTRSAIPAMLAGGDGGHVLCVSTSLVDRANARIPAALASLTKGGLVAVTRELAIEYAARGVRANADDPGVRGRAPWPRSRCLGVAVSQWALWTRSSGCGCGEIPLDRGSEPVHDLLAGERHARREPQHVARQREPQHGRGAQCRPRRRLLRLGAHLAGQRDQLLAQHVLHAVGGGGAASPGPRSAPRGRGRPCRRAWLVRT